MLAIMMMQPNCISWVGHRSIQPKSLAHMRAFRHTYKHKQTDNNFQIYRLLFGNVKSANTPKSVQNHYLQDYHILPKWKLSKISPFQTTKPPQIKITQNQSFQDHFIISKWIIIRIRQRPPHPSKVEIVGNHSFQ